METWDPFEEFNKMHREMDRMFARMMGGFKYEPNLLPYAKDDGSLATASKKHIRPAKCNMCETETGFLTTLELPGVDKKDINLSVTDTELEVSVKQKKENKEQNKDAYSYVFSSQEFYRRLPFPKRVDSSKAKATYKNGILRVEVPKSEIGKDNRIEIE